MKNDGPENDGPRKYNDWKLQYLVNEKPNCTLSSEYYYLQ